MYLPKFSRAKDQGRTEDEPKNSQTQKSTFIKIAVLFPSLIPCLIPPRGHRQTTERTPTEPPCQKRFCFLRLLPNQVVLIPKKVVPLPKKVDSFPEIVDLSVF